MSQPITTITLVLPYRLGSVNCYLITTGSGFVLIDTGAANRRAELERLLTEAGCAPGKLDLIVLTHGDFDHTGNAAFLRDKFGAQIAMHADDGGMAERGDMFHNRKSGNAIVRVLSPILFRFRKSDRFQADLWLEEGYDLAGFGLEARIVQIPGHSQGSIGILTAGGDLLCGDLFENPGEPALNTIMDDKAAAQASLRKLASLGKLATLEKLAGLEIQTVYPGHGRPFPMAAWRKANAETDRP
jgi:hydroxyacylglutathione hydrolase